jgi:hypothetical protein
MSSSKTSAARAPGRGASRSGTGDARDDFIAVAAEKHEGRGRELEIENREPEIKKIKLNPAEGKFELKTPVLLAYR